MTTIPADDPEFREPGSKPGRRRGLRVVEVFSALCVLGLLVALFLPATRTARPAARWMQCVNNLRQIALALHLYEQDYKVLPPAYTTDAIGRPLHSWRTLILPYLEQRELYQTIDLSKPWNDPANAKALETSLYCFHCPAVTGPGNMTTYLAIVAPEGCFHLKKPRDLAEITDAHGSTLLVIEAAEGHAVPWMTPTDASESVVLGIGMDGKLHHAGGTNGCFVDGSVRFLSESTPAEVLRAMVTISGNENEVIQDQ